MSSRSWKRTASGLTALAVLLALLLFLALPAHYAESVKTGVMLWAVNVLPATLPLLVLTALLTHTALFPRIAGRISPMAGKLFAISGAGVCAGLLSLVSGYPVGARTVSDFKAAGHIGEDELLRVSALASTSGPAFLVGAVGAGIFSSVTAGWVLYLAHVLGVLTICFFMRFRAKSAPAASPPQTLPPRALPEILQSSVLSVLCVGGTVAVFYAFGAMVSDLGGLISLPAPLIVFLRGLLEMTSGCSAFLGDPTPLALAQCAFFVTFGGVSVLVQQLAFLGPAGVPAGKFVGIKLLQGIAAAGFALLLALGML